MRSVGKNAAMYLSQDRPLDGVSLDRSLDPTVDWRPDLKSRSVTLERVYAITFTPMSEMRRNELITLAYQDIASELARLLDTELPTWATFGQWPSDIVGTILRMPIPMIRQSIQRSFGWGNQAVFYDIGQSFVALIEALAQLGPKPNFDADDVSWNDFEARVIVAWVACLKVLRSTTWEPPLGQPGVPSRMAWRSDPSAVNDQETWNDHRPTTGGNARLLYVAMWTYMDSQLARNARQRDQRIYAANIFLAAHEQWVLQLPLASGLRLPIRRVLYPRLNRMPKVQLRRTDLYVERNPGFHETARAIEKRSIHAITRWVMGIRVGSSWISVGRSLQQQGLEFHDHLDVLEDPSARQVADLFGDADDRRTDCWLSYEQRMRFIANLFRRRYPTRVDPTALAISREQQRRIRARAGSLVFPVPYRPAVHRSPEQQAVHDHRTWTFDEARGKCDPLDGDLTFRPDRIDPEEIRADIAERWKCLTPLISVGSLKSSADFFKRYRLLVLLSLLSSSIPDGYAASRGSKVLDLESLLGKFPTGRIVQTLDFVLSVSDEDLAPTNDVLNNSIARVRRMHLVVRRRLRQTPLPVVPDLSISVQVAWNEALYGLPINDEDQFGTMLSFVVPVIETFERIGVNVPVDIREALLHRWCAIGYLLGGDLDLITRLDNGKRRFITYAEAEQDSALIRSRHHIRSLHGVRLMSALTKDLGDHFPAGLGPVPEMIVRAVGDPDVCDLLLVKDTLRSRALRQAFRVLGRVLSSPGVVGRFGLSVMTWLGDVWYTTYRTRNVAPTPQAAAMQENKLQDWLAKPWWKQLLTKKPAARQPPIGWSILRVFPQGCEGEADDRYKSLEGYCTAVGKPIPLRLEQRSAAGLCGEPTA